jgi:hypothetical protein
MLQSLEGEIYYKTILIYSIYVQMIPYITIGYHKNYFIII